MDEWRQFDPRKEWERNVTDEQKKRFLDIYKQIRPNAQIFKSVESENHNQMDRPLELTKSVKNFTASLDGSESEQDIVNKFLEAIPLNAKEVSQIERETKAQSDSFSWIRHRKEWITTLGPVLMGLWHVHAVVQLLWKLSAHIPFGTCVSVWSGNKQISWNRGME